jgi:predicted nucleic acid-binding Zn ribbon protein
VPDAERPEQQPGPDLSGSDLSRSDLTGPELARAVLDAARARRLAGRPAPRRADDDPGADPSGEPAGDSGPGGGGGGPGTGRARQRRRGGYTGSGPDPRDPQPVSAILDRLIKARGWQRPTAEATVFAAWERVVGPDVAAHSRPVKLENGTLTVEAESTAWATQLRLLAASLLQRIAAQVGHDVVRKLYIHGPAAPSWSRGPLRVRGRGPRDTYG